MKFIAIVTRTLRPDKTLEDYRRAWFHTEGFGVPATMYTVVNVANPREIISVGILDYEPEQAEALLRIDVEQRLANPLDDVIESQITRTFGIVASVDDFSAAGEIAYGAPKIDGRPADWDDMGVLLQRIGSAITRASEIRDTIRAEDSSE